MSAHTQSCIDICQVAKNKLLYLFFFFLYIPIKYYQTYLRSTILTILTLQYHRDEYPRGAKVHVYPKGINILTLIKEKKKGRKIKETTETKELETTNTVNKND